MSRPRAAKRAKSLLIAESSAMQKVAHAIEELAESGQPVLVVGERGVGREMVARILHHAGGKRTGEFVVVRGGSAPRTLFVTSKVPGSGATLRAAAGGSLLVKDVCQLPRATQRRLLKVLAPSTRRKPGDDVRIIGSSDLDLEVAVEAGMFARELYDRLAAHRIEVPPLRERVADIPLLAAHLIREYGRDVGRNRMTLSTRGYQRLIEYPWPGNVAELKGIARRMVYRAKKNRIEAGDVDVVLPKVAERVPLEEMSFEEMVSSKLAAFLRRVDGYPVTNLYDDVVSRVERPLLDLVMKATGGNQLRAAEILGLNRNTLRRKLSQHGMLSRMRTKAARAGRGRTAATGRTESGSKR